MKKRVISPESQKGQASIMIGIMMLTFLFFFCFVVNVGMLVNAKINLQNAADMAAYSGAAVQARHLNHISYLNYEMRRQYKKFLFRYYVIGNMAQKQFPSTVSGSPGQTPMRWSPDAGKVDYKLPVVCLIFNNQDNFCQIDTLPAINIPPRTNFDAINDALIGQLQNLEKIRINNCNAIGATNLFVLQMWLWNTNPDATTDTGFTKNQEETRKLVAGLIKGLGLVPRELLIRQRIKSLQDYVNSPPQKDVTFDKAQALGRGGDPVAAERTLQAFYSAFYTLGNHTFQTDGIQMDEIQNEKLLELVDVKTNFDTYAIFYNATGAAKSDCVPQLVPQTLKSEIPVGVYKDPKLLTYYAVRLRAKAKLLFNPWGPDGLELKAYAAAQPFGSRIGPGLEANAWIKTGATPGIAINLAQTGAAFTPLGQIPNLPITREDTPNKGWDSREVLGTYLATAFPTPASAGPAGGVKITETDLSRAYQVAMAPNPWETRFYNIPNDLGPFDAGASFSRSIFDGEKGLSFWAPIVPPSRAGSIDADLQSMIEDLLRDAGPEAQNFKNTVKSQLNAYLSKLRNGQGEDGESFNLARISDPFRPRVTANDPSGGGGALIDLPEWVMPRDPKIVLSSWNAPNDPPKSGAPGRLGYSVKFVSFDSLTKNKPRTDSTGQNQSENPPGAGDEEAEIDLNFIQH